jgi:hypothetical protein
VSPESNGKMLDIGTEYTLKADPAANNLFSNWFGGAAQPYTVLGTNLVYKFAMQSNLFLQANFVTNVFLAAAGTYRGLIGPLDFAPRQQNSSGSFMFSITRSGALSGNLEVGGQMVPCSGKFGLDGVANIVTKPIHGIPALTNVLQLNFGYQAISGTVSDGTFSTELSGSQDVFNSSNPATNYQGQYTWIIRGTNDPAIGPFGVSCGTLKVDALGNITLTGSLADGTTISQSSVVSQDGNWPFYMSLYGGKGSLWGQVGFAPHSHELAAPFGVSWINEINSSKTAVYRSGFTNQQAILLGGFYTKDQSLPPGLTATLQETNPPFTITVSNLLENTNNLTLKTNKATGLITGSFAWPGSSKPAIKVNGVILQAGQTNAQGYFLGTNQSGTFLLDAP